MRTPLLYAASGPALPVLLGLLVATGVQAQQAQSDAHAHIRHASEAFTGTPAGMGLLPTAAAEADIALEHARLARRDSLNVTGMRRHAGHVLHALDPTASAGGPGMGYGVSAAAAAAAVHVQLVAESNAVSDNVAVHAPRIVTSLENVVGWTEEAVSVAQRIQTAPSVAEAGALMRRLLTLCEAIAYGTDRNGDGVVGWEEGEGGLAQARYHMNAMKRGEGLIP